MTDCYITAGTISIPNPVRWGDPFAVTFTYHANNWLPEDFTYNIYSVLPSGEPTLMATSGDWFGSYLVPKTVTLTCSGIGINCGFRFEPMPPIGTTVTIVLEVVADGTPDGYARWLLANVQVAAENGLLTIEGSNLPTQVTPLQEVPLTISVHATGNPVLLPMAGIYQVSGPQIQIQGGSGWIDLPTNINEAVYTVSVPTLTESIQDFTVMLKMPDEGWLLDPNTGQTATIGIVGARRNAVGVAIQYPSPVSRTTFIRKTVPSTCTESAERCVKLDGTLGGCIKQVCHDNAWIKTSDNDPTCPNCGTTNHTCLGKSGLQVLAGSIECGHEGACFRSTCNGLTGLWGNPVKDVTCGTGTQCADPKCFTAGETSCDTTKTNGSPCTNYECVSGQWRKVSDQGIMDCGATCAVQNPVVIGAIAVGVVGLAAVVYLISSRSSSRPPSSSGRKTYSRWEAPDYPRQRRR